jgi:hypothetical protein
MAGLLQDYGRRLTVWNRSLRSGRDALVDLDDYLRTSRNFEGYHIYISGLILRNVVYVLKENWTTYHSLDGITSSPRYTIWSLNICLDHFSSIINHPLVFCVYSTLEYSLWSTIMHPRRP